MRFFQFLVTIVFSRIYYVNRATKDPGLDETIPDEKTEKEFIPRLDS